jgi:prefoldin subunit 5
MPDGSVECGIIIEQLGSIRREIAEVKSNITREITEVKEDIADLKKTRAQSDGERSALAKIGAGVLGLCALIGTGITVLVNWPKISGQ